MLTYVQCQLGVQYAYIYEGRAKYISRVCCLEHDFYLKKKNEIILIVT